MRFMTALDDSGRFWSSSVPLSLLSMIYLRFPRLSSG